MIPRQCTITTNLTVDQLRDLAKRRDLESRHTLRIAARLQSEADACRKEIRRRQRELKRIGASESGAASP